MNKWDERFIELCKHISYWSKDPSTRVGAVVARDLKEFVSMGYNGFPSKVEDSEKRYENRELKYELVLHAEANAILRADRARLKGATIYIWPIFSCHDCAKLIIQSGITRVVAPTARIDQYPSSMLMFQEAGIAVDLY